MSFEKFNKGRAEPLAREVSVKTYDRSGKIYIGKELWENVGKPEYLVMYFDKKQNLVGMKPAGDKTNAYTVNNYKQTGTRDVAPMAFIKKYNIEDGRYDATVQDDMIIFEVDRKEVSK